MNDEKKIILVISTVASLVLDLNTVFLHRYLNIIIVWYAYIYGYANIKRVNILKNRNTKCKDVHYKIGEYKYTAEPNNRLTLLKENWSSFNLGPP